MIKEKPKKMNVMKKAKINIIAIAALLFSCSLTVYSQTPSYVSSEVKNTTPTRIEITYSVNLDTIVPASAAFSVLVNTLSRPVTAVAISGTRVVLFLPNAIIYGDVITVSYAMPSINQLRSISGEQAGSMTAQAVTNNVAAGAPPILDGDSQTYSAVGIGFQIWLKENLKTSKYSDGTPIPLVTDASAWSNLTTPGYCWYNNDAAANKDTYGALYNWYAVNKGNLCPAGWHIPNVDEWATLTSYLGGAAVAGGKLKETGFSHWLSPNTGATDEVGFTALPGGYRGYGGGFALMGTNGYWWTPTESATAGWAYPRSLNNTSTWVYTYDYTKDFGLSVRCVFNVLPLASITGTKTVNRDAAQPDITFTGIAGTAPFTFTYNINGGSDQTISTTSGNSVTVSAPTGTAGTYKYSLIRVQDAYRTVAQTGSATITVNPLPTATSFAATDITLTTATLQGTVNANGQSTTVTFEYGTTQAYGRNVTATPNPINGTINTSVSATISGLLANTTYYFRVKAVYQAGTTFGSEKSFTTYKPDAIVDVEGNYYNTVTIGNQIWTAENLRVKHYNNSDLIPTTSPAIKGISSETSPEYQWSYKDALLELPVILQPAISAGAGGLTFAQAVSIGAISPSQKTILENWATNLGIMNSDTRSIQSIYDECINNSATWSPYHGLLYTWYAVADSRKLCPSGWHVPSDVEWTNLTDYLTINGYGYQGSGDDIGKSMAATWGWMPYTVPGSIGNDQASNNSSGFSALPGGYRMDNITFGSLGISTIWWTATAGSTPAEAWYRAMDHATWGVGRSDHPKQFGFSVRCINDILLPTVSIDSIMNLTQISASGYGTVQSDGGATVTERGLCWNTNPNPTTDLATKTSNGTGTGVFSGNLTSLTPGTTYYIRAYAKNGAGTAYSNEITFTTYNADAITDVDGNYYNIVNIGSQTWIAGNLRVIHFNDGTTDIPNVSDNTAWGNLTSAGYSWYNNELNTGRYPTLGPLYNWYAVNTGKLCPVGWRVPSDADWTVLSNYLGGESVAGGKLKETGLKHWLAPNTAATDEYGFTALPGGTRHIDGTFSLIGVNGFFSSSTEYSSTYGWVQRLTNSTSSLDRLGGHKNAGYSIRCINDPLIVTNVSDNGVGSFRKALESTNSNPGMDIIAFNIRGTGPYTIKPLTPLPAITETVVIDGFSQPGSDASKSKLLIELDGTNAGSQSNGLTINADNCVIKGVVINRFNRFGISINGNFKGNKIAGNYIGTDINGTTALGNNGSGIYLSIESSESIIGGTTIAERNIISGNNGNGVFSHASSRNSFLGNYIGVDVSGKLALGNKGYGLYIAGGSENIIGGANLNERNVISSNGSDGVSFQNSAHANTMKGNFIGVDASGQVALGNSGNGVSISSVTTNTIVGGINSGEGNIIAFNSGSGISIIRDGTINNSITANSIYSNKGLGINLNADAVTANDLGDIDDGPNKLQNFPVLDLVKFSPGKVDISGRLNSTPNTEYILQFFASKVADESGYGEGQKFLGSDTVVTGTDGNITFDKSLAIFSSWGTVITATATDPQGNTSEFSGSIGGFRDQIIPTASWPLTFRTNEAGVDRITDGSDIAAVASSFATWNAITTASIRFENNSTTPVNHARMSDGINLVTFTDDEFDLTPGIIAVAAKTLRLSPTSNVAEIIDADIVVNPAFAKSDIGVGPGNFYDIQSIITHEIGHVLGLNHTGVANSTMFYMLDKGTKVRTLEQDDKSWAGYRYPGATYNTTFGSISGKIRNGYFGDANYPVPVEPVAGALVLAINTATHDTIHSYSDANGEYLVPGLLPGSYNIFIEPLDGSKRVHYLKPGNVSSYVYSNTIYTDFPGEFYNTTDVADESNELSSFVTVNGGHNTPDINLITNLDKTHPKVLSAKATDVSGNLMNVLSNIVITFSERMDMATLTDATCYLDSAGTKFTGSFTTLAGNIVLFDPDIALKYSTAYSLNITDGVKDMKGNGLEPFTPVIFTTIPADNTPPKLMESIPAAGATNVFVTDKIILSFSEPMNTTSVESGFTISYTDSQGGEKTVDGTLSWNDDYTTFTYAPWSSLKEGQLYTITLTNGIKDLSSNPLSNSGLRTFTTLLAANPSIKYIGPGKDQTGVTVNTPVVVDFSEPVNPNSVNSSTFRLLSGNTIVTGAYEFLNENSRVVFRPEANLDFNKIYTIEITTGIEDVSVPVLPLLEASITTFTTSNRILVPHLYYIDPPAAVAGSLITISGTGFDPNPVNNIVDFTGIKAVVKRADLASLLVKVPNAAMTGPVSVSVKGIQADNTMHFDLIPQSYDPCEYVTVNSEIGTKSTHDSDLGTEAVGTFAYVTNPTENTLSVIPLGNFVYTGPTKINVGQTPMKIDIDPSGKRAYVTNFYSQDVSVIDLSTKKEIKRIKVGIEPYGIAVTPDGKRVYVANSFSQNLYMIDTDPASGGFDHVVANVPTGTNSGNVVITPDATMVLVTGDFGLKIVCSDPKDQHYNSVTANVPTGTKTVDADITPDAGFAIVSTQEGSLLVVNLHPENGDYSDAVVANVPTGTQVSDVVMSGDNMFVYVADIRGNNILVYRLTPGGTGTSGGSTTSGFTLLLDSTIPVGVLPQGMVMNAKSDILYFIDGDKLDPAKRRVSSVQLCCGPIDPARAIGDIITTIQNMINNGTMSAKDAQDLIKKLNDALKNLSNGETSTAINNLKAYTNKIKALGNSRKISTAQCKALVDAANAIISQLKGTKSATIESYLADFIQPDDNLISESRLGDIYPNPFSKSVVINYEIADKAEDFGKVLVRVYDINGGIVRTLIDKTMQTGRYTVIWDSNNNNGSLVPEGTYIVHFHTGNVEMVRKIVLIR